MQVLVKMLNMTGQFDGVSLDKSGDNCKIACVSLDKAEPGSSDILEMD